MIFGFMFLLLTVLVAAFTPYFLKRQKIKLTQGKYSSKNDGEIETTRGKINKKKLRYLQDIWGIRDIKNGIAITDEGYYRLYIKTGSLDYYMMPNNDQDRVDSVLISMAMSLNIPIELITTTEMVDTKPGITAMYNYLNEPMADSMRLYTINSIEYLDGLMQNRAVNVKKSYVVVSDNKSPNIKKATAELYRRAETLIGMYARADIKSQIIDTSGVIDLLFRMLNRGKMVKPSELVIAGGMELYKEGRKRNVFLQETQGERANPETGDEHSETA